jgi:hypothetical protein
MTRRAIDRSTTAGLLVVLVSTAIYWIANATYDAGRGDFFYLADAFLHGRTWIDIPVGPNDVIVVDGRSYVPFAPFPAIAVMPLVAIVGDARADAMEPLINAVLAGWSIGLCWWLAGRLGVERLRDRLWLVVLYGFSTQILWVTVRGGVWHTGHLVAAILTFASLIELWGRQRAWLVGLLAGFAFLTRAPLAFAIPFYALMLDERVRSAASDTAEAFIERMRRAVPWRAWAGLVVGVLPSIILFFGYNQVRFGSPFESGYGLATLPPFLEVQRERGLFSLAHVPMNLDYFLVHLPTPALGWPYLRPDGLGMSVLLTSPGLLLALRADWRRPRTWWLAGATIAVLVPTLLYYGGGWLQYGYRYFLDSVPFVLAMCALAVARAGRVGRVWQVLIIVGVIVMAPSVYWVYHL